MQLAGAVLQETPPTAAETGAGGRLRYLVPMGREPLRSLVEALPRSESPLDVVTPVASFDARPHIVRGYVWPDVALPDEPLSPIVLIRSSGAMGKSCAARALASELRAPLVDLAKTRVGTDSLTGLLAKALGWTGAAEFTTALRRGERVLVLDGLDEAQLLVGKESYLAFLANVLELVDPTCSAVQVVAFGRHDAVETTTIAVLMDNQSASVVPLLPLTPDQARLLIDETLDLDEQCTVHRQHRGPWEELRDDLFDDISRALLGRPPSLDGSDWPKIEDFLGYAPVVMAIAESLNVPNPAAEAARLRASVQADVRLNRGRLLKGIVDTILDRDQKKVSKHLADALELGPDSEKLIYRAEEQVVRTIAATTGVALVAAPPQSIPPAEKAKYEDLIQPWVLDHPFLRDRQFANVVFRDFLRAFVSTSPLTEIFGVRRTELIGACGPVGPFFAHFVHAMTIPASAGSDAFAYGVVSEDLVDDLIKSNALGSDQTPHAAYIHRGSAHLTLGEWEASRPSYGFHIDEPVGLLVLRSPVSRVYVDTEYAVVLQPAEDRVDLGPNAIIVAGDVEIGGSKVAAYPNHNTDIGGLIIAENPPSHSPDLVVKAYGDFALVGSWPDPTYQWRPFTIVEPRDVSLPIGRHSRQRLFHAMRRLLTGFRAGDPPWMYYERYDNYVVGSNPLHVSCREALQALDVLRRVGDNYELNLDRLGGYGISYAGLRGDDWQSCLQQLAADVINQPSVADQL